MDFCSFAFVFFSVTSLRSMIKCSIVICFQNRRHKDAGFAFFSLAETQNLFNKTKLDYKVMLEMNKILVTIPFLISRNYSLSTHLHCKQKSSKTTKVRCESVLPPPRKILNCGSRKETQGSGLKLASSLNTMKQKKHRSDLHEMFACFAGRVHEFWTQMFDYQG